jgi:RNA polymerase sigma-70 factor (ECF subfamily)
MKVAHNKGIDRIRKGQSEARKANDIGAVVPTHFEAQDADQIPDERLRLIFTCCHPSLGEKSRVSLTLRTVCNLTTREIAAAFLDTDVTIGQRISRAKTSLKDAGVGCELPEPEAWPARLNAVLSTVYLIYTIGYVGEDRSDRDLGPEAIFLMRLLNKLCPDDPEIEGALALVLLTEARREARVGNDGATVPPGSQNRQQWNTHRIAEGRDLLSSAMQRRHPGPYQIKAAIADCHMAGLTPDWQQISLLYGALWPHEPTPVVALNWATVMAELGEVDLALSRIETLGSELTTFQPYYAAYANVLVKARRVHDAKEAYSKAIYLAQSPSNRKFLENTLRQLQI